LRDNQECLHRIKEGERDVDTMRMKIEDLEKRERGYLNEIAVFERSITVLNGRLESAENLAKETLEIKDKLAREVHGVKRDIEGVEISREDLQRKLLALERENDDLKVELRRYKRGLDETRTDIDLENRKVKEMEKLLEDERRGQWKYEQQIRILTDEKRQLLHTIEDQKMQIIDWQRRALREEKDHLLGKRTTEERPDDLEDWEQRLKSRMERSRVLRSPSREEREEFRSSIGGSREDWKKDRDQSYNTKSSKVNWESTFGREGSEELERKRQESESFQKSLDYMSNSSRNLKEKIQSLKGEYSFGGRVLSKE